MITENTYANSMVCKWQNIIALNIILIVKLKMHNQPWKKKTKLKMKDKEKKCKLHHLLLLVVNFLPSHVHMSKSHCQTEYYSVHTSSPPWKFTKFPPRNKRLIT